MRIVHYYRDIFRPSGVTKAIWGWQNATLEAGFATIALHAGEPSQWSLPSEHVKHFGSGRQLQVPDLRGAIGQGDILFLHEGWVSSNLVAAHQARSLGVPYVVVPHGVYEPEIRSDLKEPVRLRMALERRMLGGAAAVQVFYGSERPYVWDLQANAETICVATGSEVPTQKWIGSGEYLAWFGRYSPRHKGIDRMLSAYAAVPANLRIPLRLRGMDYQGGRRAVEGMVQSLGLGSTVSVGGPVLGSEKIQFLAESAGFVFPSRWESQGISLLEALGLGAPCVVSDSIHLASDLKAKSAAVATDFSNPKRAGRAIMQAANDQILGERGRKYVEEELAWEGQVTKLMSYVRRHVD